MAEDMRGGGGGCRSDYQPRARSLRTTKVKALENKKGKAEG